MSTLFILIFICSLWTLGLTIASQEGMILYKWREWADTQCEKGNNYQEVLIRCHLCMPSIYSLIAYVFAVGMGVIKGFTWNLVFMYPLVVCGSSVVNCIVWGIRNYLYAATEYYERHDIILEDNTVHEELQKNAP